MLPPAVIEQQARLGVSTEDSKAQRLKRQQARFRDRGGAFVPSNSNPLVDILLARTVSGESPSKAHPKDVARKRRSLSKRRRSSLTPKTVEATVSERNQPMPGSSKSKPVTSRMRNTKVVEQEVNTDAKPATKRRGRPPKVKKKTPGPDSDTKQSHPDRTKVSSKGKSKQRNTITASSDPNTKPKSKGRTRSNPARQVEVLVSDDDQTLVEVPHKPKPKHKRIIRHHDNGETDDDAPIVRKRAVDNLIASSTMIIERLKTERLPGTPSLGEKTREDKMGRKWDEEYSKGTAKKRPVPYDDVDEDIVPPSPKRGKATKLRLAIEPKLIPPKTKVPGNGKIFIGREKAYAKGGTNPDQDISKDDDQGPSQPSKRKKEGGNYDDRPRKAVKFADVGPPYSSSQKLKENQLDEKHKQVAKGKAKGEVDALGPKLTASRTKTSKGPPREVLERIKASAVRHLRCADSEPDELDCLS